ncbi:MAG: amylo-alpha-1,6-glucosidase [Anaerolineae bacterium]|nr:amylo-alpha-1,6-glucosidase [Anaerolineae bacterium]
MPEYSLGRAEIGQFRRTTRKEWLVTNGLGGFAAGTVGGVNTRRYHGLLVAALRPPLERTMLVAKLDTWAEYAQRSYPLFCNEFAAGTIDPHGYRYLESFHLDGLIPVWTFALADAQLEQRVWMVHGHNTTYVTFTLTRATGPVSLHLTPLCTYRDYHSHTRGGWQLNVTPVDGGFEVNVFEGAQPYRVVANRGRFHPHPEWYWNFKHQAERHRGLDDIEDLLATGRFEATLEPGETLTVVCSTEPVAPHDGLTAMEVEQQRQQRLKKRLSSKAPGWIKQLVFASDQFIVQRPVNDLEKGVTIIAGYPWFGDWGRDTMIALPGLTLTTKRPDVAASILYTFAEFISEGMLPNRFPDSGEIPDYNTADATLWYIHAIYQHYLATKKLTLIRQLYPVMVDIIEWHQRGTRYNIKVDPEDGLLFAGETGLQLTWMDAKLGNRVITPRIGKPVEVNALWYNALRIVANFSRRLRKTSAARAFDKQADRVETVFSDRFWFKQGGYLYDVIDIPNSHGQPDASLRPNQIFAVSLPFKLLPGPKAKAVVDVCGRHLVTSYGLRSLTPDHKAYIGLYGGGQYQRDEAYHQGTVWAWLLGPFARAHYCVYGDKALARSFLSPLKNHLTDGGLGSISEIFDGDPPHEPRGCFAQAWSVAEVLRAWQELG